MGVIIEESGMCFGEYDESQVFQIETSKQYTKSLRDIPADKIKEKKEAYDAFIKEIVLKLRHSLSLYGNILLKRYSEENIPVNMVNPDLSNTEIYLILVINPKNGIWEPEPELQDDIRYHMEADLKIWKIKSLLVISAQTAREKKFII
ncbi:MAG: hypothetical protein Q4C65_09495 [Eubacteriales bacterium]|nr:hypothetical protein [Eubacteriales bacterium]